MRSLIFLRLLDDKRVAEEIERYKWIESERIGRDIGKETAALEWIKAYGHIWLKIHKPCEYRLFTEEFDKNPECCGVSTELGKA